jgi:hypothetical protein
LVDMFYIHTTRADRGATPLPPSTYLYYSSQSEGCPTEKRPGAYPRESDEERFEAFILSHQGRERICSQNGLRCPLLIINFAVLPFQLNASFAYLRSVNKATKP